ncbi:43038_t:CDS:2, partial [Gigaspora margarita]
MFPEQIELWLKFNNVVLNDCTAATNRYEIALSIFLIVDNHLYSRMVVQQIKKATRNAVPQVIFTDADLAVFVTICDKFSTTKALYWHQTEQLNEQPNEQSNEQSDVEESCSESDEENIDPKDLANPHKQKSKGRPKGTDRKRQANELPKEKRQQS